MDDDRRSIQWLAAADALWLIGGIVAYVSSVSLLIMTAIALVPALPGLMALRDKADGDHKVWFDRAMTFAAGTFGLIAMLILIPYATSEAGTSLWATREYIMLGFVVSSTGMLGWNVAALHGLDAGKDVRMHIGLHAALILASVWFALNGVVGSRDVMLRGETFTVLDMDLAPALAAVPGLMWAGVFWQRQARD